LIILIPGLPLFPVMWLSQTLNAVFLPLLLVMVLKLVNNPRLMGKMVNSRFQNIAAVILTIAISVITVMLFVFSV